MIFKMKKFYTITSIICFICITSFATIDIALLKKQLDSSPENLKIRHNLAQAYFDIGKYDLVVEVLRLKAEKLPQDSLALLSQSYQKLNDPLNERKFLDQLTVNYPKFAQGFVLLGDYYYRNSLIKNDPGLSMNCLVAYRTAIELNPAYRPAYDGLVMAYEKFKNFYELRILLEDMVKKFGKSPDILSSLCRRNTIDGYFVNARKVCTDAMSIDVKNPENTIYLSLVENNEGEISRADTLLKNITEKFPESEFANSNYADFLIQQKNYPGAESLYRAAVKANPKSFRAQIGLAQTCFELKHYEPALEAFKDACFIQPHQTYRRLKKSADLLRHRSEVKLEERYTNAMERCLSTGDENRAPAQAKEEYRSPFALFSKNKIIDPIGF